MAMTYATLQSDIQDWALDQSVEIQAQLDNLIDMAENRLARDLRTLGVDTVTTGTLTSSNRLLAIPAGFLRVSYFRIFDGTDYAQLSFRTLDVITDYWPQGNAATGTPRYWSFWDTTSFVLAPTPSGAFAYELGTLARLSGTQTATWLSANAEEALRYACLIEAAAYKQDQALLQTYSALYGTAIAALNGEARRDLSDAFKPQE